MIYYILTLLIIAFILWYYYQNFYLWQKKTNITGPSVFKSMRVFKLGYPKILLDYMKANNIHKDFFGMWMGPLYIVMAVDPDAAKFVLKESRFRKIGLFNFSNKQEEYFGKNLVAVDGDDWRRLRNIINSGFTNQSLSSYFPTFLELTDKAIDTIPQGRDFEVTDFFSRFTLDVLGKTIFNHDFGRIEGRNDKYYDAYKTFFEIFSSPWGRALYIFPFLLRFPIKPIQNYLEGMNTLVQLFKDMIKQHKETLDNSLLSKLLMAVDNPEILSEQELIANIWIFFLAGHETTSTALTYELNYLRLYPDIQEKIHEEIIRVLGSADRTPTEEDIEKLEYLDTFVQEVLRIHSPVPALATRVATEDVKYKDMIIPKGSRVGINFQAIHLNPEHWDDPEKFDPDRFKPENRKGKNHFSHLPFSAGLRQCIGNTFSLIEQRLFLTRLLQKYRVVDPKQSKPFPKDDYVVTGGRNNVSIGFEKR